MSFKCHADGFVDVVRLKCCKVGRLFLEMLQDWKVEMLFIE